MVLARAWAASMASRAALTPASFAAPTAAIAASSSTGGSRRRKRALTPSMVIRTQSLRIDTATPIRRTRLSSICSGSSSGRRSRRRVKSSSVARPLERSKVERSPASSTNDESTSAIQLATHFFSASPSIAGGDAARAASPRCLGALALSPLRNWRKWRRRHKPSCINLAARWLVPHLPWSVKQILRTRYMYTHPLLYAGQNQFPYFRTCEAQIPYFA